MINSWNHSSFHAYECFNCACLCLTLYSCLGTSYVETTRTSFRILIPAPCMPPSLQWPIHPSIHPSTSPSWSSACSACRTSQSSLAPCLSQAPHAKPGRHLALSNSGHVICDNPTGSVGPKLYFYIIRHAGRGCMSVFSHIASPELYTILQPWSFKLKVMSIIQ